MEAAELVDSVENMNKISNSEKKGSRENLQGEIGKKLITQVTPCTEMNINYQDGNEALSIEVESEKHANELHIEEIISAKSLDYGTKLLKEIVGGSLALKLPTDLNIVSGYKQQSDSDDTKPLIKRGRPKRNKAVKSPNISEPVNTRSMRSTQRKLNIVGKGLKDRKKKEVPKKLTQPTNSKICKTKECFKTNLGTELSAVGGQCRICLNEKNLVNLFTVEDNDTIAKKIMNICSLVKISKHDQLPQFICSSCLQSLQVALNFKTLCETTDNELRSNIKSNHGRQTEFVLIDCNEISELDDDLIVQDEEDEFHLSNESLGLNENSDSDSSFHANNRKTRRTSRKTRQKRNMSRRDLKKQIADNNKDKKINRDVISSEEENVSPPKKRLLQQQNSKKYSNNATSDGRKKEAQCVYCNQIFPSLIVLREHKKTHAGEKPFTCEICNRSFKLIGSFKSHQEKHNEADSLMCVPCNKHYPNKTELRRHLVDLHGEPVAAFVCDKCKRAFTTERRLERHKESKCPGFEATLGSSKKFKPEADSIALGRDLFRCVAPMTTTYWSDSFSE